MNEKFEYRYFITVWIDPYKIKDEEDNAILVDKLNEIGNEGWSVISVDRIVDGLHEVHYYKILAKRKI